MNQLCKVCGEPAAGFHFGAFTCEGCKSFFGRTYNNISSISECKNNGECVINKKNRTACKACRLRKCLLVGMSKSGSRYGRRSNWFKIHCLLQEQQQQHSHSPQSYRNAGQTPPPSSLTIGQEAFEQYIHQQTQREQKYHQQQQQRQNNNSNHRHHHHHHHHPAFHHPNNPIKTAADAEEGELVVSGGLHHSQLQRSPGASPNNSFMSMTTMTTTPTHSSCSLSKLKLRTNSSSPSDSGASSADPDDSSGTGSNKQASSPASDLKSPKIVSDDMKFHKFAPDIYRSLSLQHIVMPAAIIPHGLSAAVNIQDEPIDLSVKPKKRCRTISPQSKSLEDNNLPKVSPLDLTLIRSDPLLG